MRDQCVLIIAKEAKDLLQFNRLEILSG